MFYKINITFKIELPEVTLKLQPFRLLTYFILDPYLKTIKIYDMRILHKYDSNRNLYHTTRPIYYDESIKTIRTSQNIAQVYWPISNKLPLVQNDDLCLMNLHKSNPYDLSTVYGSSDVQI